jgi:DNA-binding IclR family transcriptional regulator
MSKAKQTKTERLREMLAKPNGATLEAICKVTGWQPHSARAALSGLRKAGYTIERERNGADKIGTSVYRLTAAPESTA